MDLESVVLESNESFEIVKNAPKEIWVGIVKKLLQEMNWQYSIYDFDIWHNSLDDFAIYYVIDKETEEAAAMVSLTKIALLNSRVLSTIGMFYVVPEYRSRKIGLWLFKTMFANTTDDCFLLGVKEMFEKYRDRFSFNVLTNYKFYLGYTKLRNLCPQNLDVDEEFREQIQIVDWSEVRFEKICEYDLKICGGICDRQKFLEYALSHEGTVSKVALNLSDDIIGYCRIRKIIGGHLDLGPLYADNKHAAILLLRACLDDQIDLSTLQTKDLNFYYRPISASADCDELFTKLIPSKDWVLDSLIPQYTSKPINIPTEKIYSLFETDTFYV